MKKGIVMEKHRQYTIVMTDSGLFLKAKPVGDAADIGMEVSYELLRDQNSHLFFFNPGQKIKHFFRVMTMACFVFLFALPIYFMSTAKKTYAFVHIDMSPSVELEVDDRLYVRSIRPITHDARLLVKKVKQNRLKSLNETVSFMLNKSKKLGFTNVESKAIIGVSYAKKRDISVLKTLKRYLNGNQTDWQLATFHVPKEIRKKAKEEKRPMNEVMAKSLEENQPPRAGNENINHWEKAIIQSFYPIQQESAQ